MIIYVHWVQAEIYPTKCLIAYICLNYISYTTSNRSVNSYFNYNPVLTFGCKMFAVMFWQLSLFLDKLKMAVNFKVCGASNPISGVALRPRYSLLAAGPSTELTHALKGKEGEQNIGKTEGWDSTKLRHKTGSSITEVFCFLPQLECGRNQQPPTWPTVYCLWPPSNLVRTAAGGEPVAMCSSSSTRVKMER